MDNIRVEKDEEDGSESFVNTNEDLYISFISQDDEDEEDYNDNGEHGLSQCEDMCPEEEVQKRINESDIHKLEMSPNLRATMIKKFQRSSADHELQIPHLLRTPSTLLRTVHYVEEHIMTNYSPSSSSSSEDLLVYLFVWDRYRMIAKDFTLQISERSQPSPTWVECHERMARWFILMDHRMKANGDFVAGHAQQNGEQLNNLLKTLHGCYLRAQEAGLRSVLAHRAEFVGYFVLFQLGNGGEVAKFLQKLDKTLLQFFRLLREEADLLQACLLHRYVGEVRLAAMRRLLRSLSPPGVAGPIPKAVLPLADLTQLLCFEDKEDASEFCEHVGLELLVRRANPNPTPAAAQSVWCRPNLGDVSVTCDSDIGLQMDTLTQELSMPRDKNGHAILPTVRHMHKWIEMDKASSADGGFLPAALICRGQGRTATLKSANPPPSIPIPIPRSKVQISAPAPQLPPPPAPPVPAASISSAPSDSSSEDMIRLGQLKKKLLLSGSLSSSRSSNSHSHSNPSTVAAIAIASAANTNAKPVAPQPQHQPPHPPLGGPGPGPGQPSRGSATALSDRDFPPLGGPSSSSSIPPSSLGLGLGPWQKRSGPPSAPAQPDLSSLQVPNPNPNLFSSAATLTHRPSTVPLVAAEKAASAIPAAAAAAAAAESTRPRPRPEPAIQQPNPNPTPSPWGIQLQPAARPIPIPIPVPSSAPIQTEAATMAAGARSGPSQQQQQQQQSTPSFKRAVDLTSEPSTTPAPVPVPVPVPVPSSAAAASALASRTALLSAYWRRWKGRVYQVRLESQERQLKLLRLGRLTHQWRALVLRRRSERSSLLRALHREDAAPAADTRSRSGLGLGLGLLSRKASRAAARSSGDVAATGEDLPRFLVDLPSSGDGAFSAPSPLAAALRSHVQRSQSHAVASALSVTNLARPRARARSWGRPRLNLTCWPGELFFQVAVVSLSGASGLGTRQDSLLVTAIRSWLSNDHGSLGGFGFALIAEEATGLASLTKNQRWKIGAKKVRAARAQMEPSTTKNARCIGLFRDPDPSPTEATAGSGRLTVAVVDVVRGGPRVDEDAQVRVASSQCVLLLLEVSALLGKEDATLTQPMQAIGRGLGQGTPLALVLCDEAAAVACRVGQVSLSQVHALVDEIADEEEAAAAAGRGGAGTGGQEQKEMEMELRGEDWAQWRIKSALRRLLRLLLSWDREQGRDRDRLGQGDPSLSLRSLGGLLLCSLRALVYIAQPHPQVSSIPAGLLSDEVRSGLHHVLERLASACPAYPLIRCVSSGDWLGERVAAVACPGPPAALPGSRGAGPGTIGPDMLKKLRERCAGWLAGLIPRVNEGIAKCIALLQDWDLRKAQRGNPTFPSPLFCRPTAYPNPPCVWNAMIEGQVNGLNMLPLDWIVRSGNLTRLLAAESASVTLPSWPDHGGGGGDQLDDPFPSLWREFERRLGQGVHGHGQGQDGLLHSFSREVNDWLCALSHSASRLKWTEVDQMMSAYLQKQLAVLVRERVNTTCPGYLYLLADEEDHYSDDRPDLTEDALTLTELSTPLKEIRGLLRLGLGSEALGLGSRPWTVSSLGRAGGGGEAGLGYPGWGSGLGKRPRDTAPSSADKKGQKLFAEADEELSPAPAAASSMDELRHPDLSEWSSHLLLPASDSKRGRLIAAAPASASPSVPVSPPSPTRAGWPTSSSSSSSSIPPAVASALHLQLRGAMDQDLQQEQRLERYLSEALGAGQLASLGRTTKTMTTEDRDRDRHREEGQMRADPLRYIEQCRQERIAFERRLQ
eukprot:gene24692-33163_t